MPSIEEIRNLSEPLKGYQFKITIANPPGVGASVQELQFRCTSAAIPGKTIEESLVNLHGYNVKHAGRSIPVGVWTATFIEGTLAQIIQRIRSWQEICHNQSSGVQGRSSEYKRNIIMELLNNDQSVSQTHRIVGAWPQDVPDVLMDSASSEPTRYDVTFAYDYHEIV